MEKFNYYFQRSEEITGNKFEMTRLVRHILNRTTTQRTISKQECMVLLSQIPLVMCSELIKTISISDSKKLSNKTRTSKDIQEYVKRSQEEESMSYAEFFQKKMNSVDSRIKK